MPQMTRRAFLQTAAASSALATISPVSGVLERNSGRVRVAVLGTGQTAVNLVAALSERFDAEVYVLSSESSHFLLAISRLLKQQRLPMPNLISDASRVYEMPEVEALCLASDIPCKIETLQPALDSGKPILINCSHPESGTEIESLAHVVSKARAPVFACPLSSSLTIQGSAASIAASLNVIGTPQSVTLSSRVLGPAARPGDFERLRTLLEALLMIPSDRDVDMWNRTRLSRPVTWTQRTVASVLGTHPLLEQVKLNRMSSLRDPAATLNVRGERGRLTVRVMPSPRHFALDDSLECLLDSVKTRSPNAGHQFTQDSLFATALARHMIMKQRFV